MPDELPDIIDPLLQPVARKVFEGEPLAVEDGDRAVSEPGHPFHRRLANFVREKLHGNQTFYNRNRHINYTNVCARVASSAPSIASEARKVRTRCRSSR